MYKCTYTERILPDDYKFFCDRTFKNYQDPFSQVYIILRKYKELSVPLYYCFLHGKNFDLYREIFKVQKNCIGDKHIAIALDLELSVVYTLKELLGRSIDNRLCFYHFHSRLDNQFREKGLNSVLSKENAKKKLSYCYNLAFVPVPYIYEIYENFVVPSLMSVARESANRFIDYTR